MINDDRDDRGFCPGSVAGTREATTAVAATTPGHRTMTVAGGALVAAATTIATGGAVTTTAETVTAADATPTTIATGATHASTGTTVVATVATDSGLHAGATRTAAGSAETATGIGVGIPATILGVIRGTTIRGTRDRPTCAASVTVVATKGNPVVVIIVLVTRRVGSHKRQVETCHAR